MPITLAWNELLEHFKAQNNRLVVGYPMGTEGFLLNFDLIPNSRTRQGILAKFATPFLNPHNLGNCQALI